MNWDQPDWQGLCKEVGESLGVDAWTLFSAMVRVQQFAKEVREACDARMVRTCDKCGLKYTYKQWSAIHTLEEHVAFFRRCGRHYIQPALLHDDERSHWNCFRKSKLCAGCSMRSELKSAKYIGGNYFKALNMAFMVSSFAGEVKHRESPPDGLTKPHKA